MRARILATVGAAALAFSGCNCSNAPTPVPTAIVPAAGYVARPTPVVIHGTGFAVRSTQSSSGGAPTVDLTQKAWIAGVELEQVRWVSDTELTAVVPAGLPAGTQDLVVENGYGMTGTLQKAFVVSTSPEAALGVTVSATPSTASVGEAFTLTAQVTNTGVADAKLTALTPLVAPASTACSVQPTPVVSAATTLVAGGTQSFSWACSASPAGTLGFNVKAVATDTFSSTSISAISSPATTVIVQTPPALSVELSAPGSVAFGNDFQVVMQIEPR